MSRSSNTPASRKLRYLDAKSLLEKRLRAMPPLAPFPSERDLCTEFGVSRTTIRRTLAEMEKEGVIHRLAGKGTFTADTKYTDHAMQSFIGFDEDARTQKKIVTNRILMHRVAPCPREEAAALRIRVGEEIFILERLRFVDGVPMCYVTSVLPLAICPEMIKEDFLQESLYDFLRKQKIVTVRAHRSIEVNEASIEEAGLLGILPGSPIFLFESVGYMGANRPLDHVRSRYPAYKARFETEVRGTDPSISRDD